MENLGFGLHCTAYIVHKLIGQQLFTIFAFLKTGEQSTTIRGHVMITSFVLKNCILHILQVCFY